MKSLYARNKITEKKANRKTIIWGIVAILSFYALMGLVEKIAPTFPI